jgi:hypothetical protein
VVDVDKSMRNIDSCAANPNPATGDTESDCDRRCLHFGVACTRCLCAMAQHPFANELFWPRSYISSTLYCKTNMEEHHALRASRYSLDLSVTVVDASMASIATKATKLGPSQRDIQSVGRITSRH